MKTKKEEKLGCSFEFCGAQIETTTPGTLPNELPANANIIFRLKFKTHNQMNLHDEFEEEEMLLLSMEVAAGIAA